VILKIDGAGTVTTLAGMDGAAGNINGAGMTGRFNYPQGMVVLPDGDLVVADRQNAAIRVLHPDALPELVYLAADQAFVTSSDQVVLRWQSRDGVSAKLSGVGEVPLSGSTSVVVTGPTMFTLEISNAAGSVRGEVRVLTEESRRRPVQP
jgi:hypothetical protein